MAMAVLKPDTAAEKEGEMKYQKHVSYVVKNVMTIWANFLKMCENAWRSRCMNGKDCESLELYMIRLTVKRGPKMFFHNRCRAALAIQCELQQAKWQKEAEQMKQTLVTQQT